MVIIGGSIIIVALILANREFRNITPISIDGGAHDSKLQKETEVKSLATNREAKDTAPTTSSAPTSVTVPIPATAPKPQPVEPDSVKKANSSKDFSSMKLYNYLSIEGNRQKVMKRALLLNNGQYRNACVYFVAEALRQNGVKLPDATCNTTGLIAQLEDQGWTRSSDYKSLRPGDICLTMDQNNGKGAPAHSYVFMAWVSPNNYDYAMICDNQADRYGNIYHQRNIINLDTYKGEDKEPFRFFMRMK